MQILTAIPVPEEEQAHWSGIWYFKVRNVSQRNKKERSLKLPCTLIVVRVAYLRKRGHFTPNSCISVGYFCPVLSILYQWGSLSFSSSLLALLEIWAERNEKFSFTSTTISSHNKEKDANLILHSTCWKSSVIRSVWLSTFLVFMIRTIAASTCNKTISCTEGSRFNRKLFFLLFGMKKSGQFLLSLK